jgi:beta-lactamase superfamily II metal-dependent hydrolase
MRKFATTLAIVLCAALAHAQNATPSPLQVYFIDVEGGQATLFVTPAGKSLLIDTGWDANNGRDADRIVATAKGAGLTKIDYVLITHFHQDHVGGVPQLLQRIPVGQFFDHGENRELTPQVTKDYNNYLDALKTAHLAHAAAKPGEVLPIEGIRVKVVSADGNLIDKPLPGAGQPNPYCKTSETRPPDQTENARSLGTLITFGKLRILDLGDLTWDKEMQLMCPNDKLGRIDILIVSHHGWNQSSSPALVDAIQARVAIMDNGAKKGGSTPVLDTIRKAPGLEALWQLHFSEEGGPAHNTDAEYIANLSGEEDKGNYLKLTANPAGDFTVWNSRTQQSKNYPAK